ncbi:hypothetical protein LCGC14_0666700 [marine sediment metagenome]|uniref:Uncharacterized protein n=1 Tax=marine sediment metagenome TaxID=412755 RepID=A0A0F9TDK0_9ZZZZ
MPHPSILVYANKACYDIFAFSQDGGTATGRLGHCHGLAGRRPPLIGLPRVGLYGVPNVHDRGQYLHFAAVTPSLVAARSQWCR